MTNKKNITKIISLKSLVILFYTLIALGFYGLVSEDLGKLLILLLVSILILVTFKNIIQRSRGFYERITKLLVVSLLLSYINAWIFWGQDPILSLRVTYGSFFILVFFYLLKTRTDIVYIEKYIIFWGVAYICVWGALMILNPTLLMPDFLQDDLSRGMLRLTLSGSCFLYLAYFLALNRWWSTKKFGYLILTLLLFAGMFFQLTRQLIFFSLIITVIYLCSRKLKYLFLSALIGLSSIFILRDFNPDNISFEPLQALVQLSIKQAEENDTEENIRIQEYKTFFSEISPNYATKLFGNSFPHYHSSFGILEKKYKEREMYLVDVGYAMIYVTLGLFGLILYCILFLHCSFEKMPENYIYPILFMAFMALYTIGTYYYSTVDGQIAMSICMYIFSQKKQLKTKEQLL